LLALLGGGSLVLAQTPSAPHATPSAAPVWQEVGSHAEGEPRSTCLDITGGLPSSHAEISAEAEYVLWLFATKVQTFPLAETSNSSGIISEADEHINRHLISGARFAIGYWLAESNPWVPGGEIRELGAEARFFFTGQRSATTRVAGVPTILRPFFDLNDQQASAVVVAAPGVASGSMTSTASANIWGAELNAWKNICYDTPGTNVSLDAMVGLRYVDGNRGLSIGRFSQFVPNPGGLLGFDASFGGNQILEQESFSTRNQFYGAQFGARLNWFLEYLIISGQFELALGATHEDLTIEGAQLRIRPNGSTSLAEGALLALPSNIGTFHRNKFSQLPELGVNVAVPLMDCLVLSLGFTALYWNHLARPSDQVSTAIDIREIPSFPGAAAAPPAGSPSPVVAFNQTSIWLLGLSFNVEVKW
jgi:hypothetical protein